SGNYIDDKAGSADSSLAALGSYASSRNAKQQANLREIDPNSMIQTGPGLPTWNWQQVSLQWSGVIQPDERMGLWLIAPLVHSLLKVLGVLVLLVLAARLALPAGKLAAVLQAARHPQQWLNMALLLGAVPWVLALPQPALAETPPPPDAALLQTLEERLLRAPDCLPDCAQIEQMNLTLGNEGLTIRLRIHAATSLAVPVPSSQSTWLPQTVLVDNAPTPSLAPRCRTAIVGGISTRGARRGVARQFAYAQQHGIALAFEATSCDVEWGRLASRRYPRQWRARRTVAT
ncbi:MAG: hypothetical protein BWK73_51470, partial [Thiothrix lacustris]